MSVLFCAHGRPRPLAYPRPIKPRSKGNRLAGNRAIVCQPCNEAKGSLSLQRFANRLARDGDPRALRVAAFLQISVYVPQVDLRQDVGPRVEARVQSPRKLTKLEPMVGVARSITGVPLSAAKLVPEHVGPQTGATGTSVPVAETLPCPLPVFRSVTNERAR
jgi:hypothetical protein